MHVRAWIAATAAVAALWPPALGAQAPRMIKVAVEFRQAGGASRDAAGAGGGVIVTERGGVRPRGGAGVESIETRVARSTGVFTLVQDGGEATLTVATRVPYAEVSSWYDYARGAGYATSGVAFRDVGTSLRVRAALLPGNQVRLRLTPTIAWFAPDAAGTIEFTEATTELVVPSGRPVALGGATGQTHAVLGRILGYGVATESRETLVTLTATVQ